MATLIDLKSSVNDVLSVNFPTTKVHSPDRKEGFAKPCFFTRIVPLNTDNETVNYNSNRTMIVINYFSKDGTELENLKMYDGIKSAFGRALKVKQRTLLIRNFTSDIIDEVLQIKFELDYLVDVPKIDDRIIMRDLDLKLERNDY